jgi:hypothetical protein
MPKPQLEITAKCQSSNKYQIIQFQVEISLELLFGWLKGIWAIGRWEEPKSPEPPISIPLTRVSHLDIVMFRSSHQTGNASILIAEQ